MGPRVNATAFVDRIAGVMGERATMARGVLEQHGRSEAYYGMLPPDVVVFPETTQEVVVIVKLCADLRLPIVPFGAGTSLEGNTAAVEGGVAVNFARMNKVLAMHADDMDVVVQPGMTRKQLNAELRGTGLFFPIDPGADASIGGMTSTRASGTMAVRYGTMKDNVMALEVVLADGRVIRTAKRARKSAAGYDLTRLFVGAEGTLGRHHRNHVEAAPVAAGDFVRGVQFHGLTTPWRRRLPRSQSAIPVARVELLDDVMMRGINLYSKLGYREAPTLFFEFHGTDAAVAEQAEVRRRSRPTMTASASNGRLPRRTAGGSGTRATTPLCWDGSAARRTRDDHRCLRADFAARRMPDRDAAGCRSRRIDCTDRRSCR